MQNLHFNCPHCQYQIDVALDERSSILVMACAQCKTPLMYCHGDVFEVDSMEVGELQQKHLKAVRGYLKVHDLESPALGVRRSPMTQLPPATHRKGEPVLDHGISREDIMDLRIDLETIDDVDEFLRRL